MRFTTFLSALALLASPALAQDEGLLSDDALVAGDDVTTIVPSTAFDRAPVRLVYDHVTRTVSLLNPDGSIRETWDRRDGTPYARVPTNRPVVLEVRNANALVYDYTFQATVARLLEPPRTCRGQARQFVLAGGLLAGQGATGETVSIPSPGQFGDPFGLDISTISALLTGFRSTKLSSSDLGEIRRQALQPLQSLAALAERLERVEETTRASVVRAARLGDVEPIDQVLASIQDELDAVQEGMSQTPRVPVVIGELLPPEDSEAIRNLLSAARAIEEGADEVEDPSGPAAQRVLQSATSAQRARERVRAAGRGIQALTLRIEDARERSHQQTTVRPGDDLREVAIVVSASSDSLASVVPTRERTVRAYLGPRRTRGFVCAVSVALTFSERPTQFGIGVEDGESVVADVTQDGLRSAPAILFELAPPGLGDVFGLVGGVGLGASDQIRAPDFYAGGSLRLFSPVLITGGAAWRRVQVLPEDLTLGDVLDDGFLDPTTFQDDFPREWKPSFFLGLSIVP